MTNSIGRIFIVTSFGESHGKCVGVVVDGCPAGLALSETNIQREVDRRKPASGTGATTRVEEDRVEIISGLFNGMTTGAPITMLVWNKDTDSSVYEQTRFIPRPGHADYTAFLKYGGFNDFRGGGRFSGRITAGLVMAGGIAKKLLDKAGIEILAHTIQIGNIKTIQSSIEDIKRHANSNPLRCADTKTSHKMTEAIEQAQQEGDSLGGVIEAIALNVPPGSGEPIFDTMEGELAKALFAIPAVKGVEFGAGFRAANSKGSENNDPFEIINDRVMTSTNNAGGILGGISNGMPIVVRIAIKPTPSISRSQTSIDLQQMSETSLKIKGRHDACIVPRAVPVVESMIAITLVDFALQAGIIPRIIK
jgi:chorismate synthase